MEPVTTIVTALALGAAAGSQSIAEKAVKDGYQGLKVIIQRCYETIKIQPLEEKPKSKARQEVLIEDLTDVEADKNLEILEQAKILIERIQNLSEAEVPAIGVKLEDIKGFNLNIEDIIASGTGVDIKRAELKGDINIKEIRAGQNNSTEKKT